VFTTNTTGSLPVVVWIYGGGYITGGAYAYNGEDLVTSADGGVVVVVIQYRLNAFGTSYFYFYMLCC
jgi:para-nitrobenzyl esterase